ncbi:unnamed protein product, partial [Bubo scandiacus]
NPASSARRQRLGERTPHNTGGDSQGPNASHKHTQVYGSRWDTPEGAEGAGWGARQAAFHHLPAVLADWG